MTTNVNVTLNGTQGGRRRHTIGWWLMIGWWAVPTGWSVGYRWLWGRRAPRI